MKRTVIVACACLLLNGCGQTADTGAVQSIAQSAEDFCGSWQCGTYFLTIESFSPGSYAGVLIRAEGMKAAEMWEYESMKFADGRLICTDGTRYDMDEDNTPPVTAYDLHQQAEFLLTPQGILWHDLSLNKGAGLCFTEGQQEPADEQAN
jgi:hypothetical protein